MTKSYHNYHNCSLGESVCRKKSNCSICVVPLGITHHTLHIHFTVFQCSALFLEVHHMYESKCARDGELNENGP